MKGKELVILLVLIGLLAYFPSFFGGFVWDDEDFVYDNAYVKEGKIDRFFSEHALSGAGKTSNYYRPIQFTLYTLLYKTAGPNPALFHAASIGVHIMASCLAFLLLNRLTNNRRASFLTALFFLIHPIQTESVSYISGMSDSIYAVFFLLSLMFFLKESGRALYITLSIVCFALSLLSKELALILPGILLIIVLFGNTVSMKEGIKRWIAFAAIALTYLVSRLTFLQFSDISRAWQGTAYGAHFTTRLATFFRSFFTYCGLLLYPAQLHMERDLTTAVMTSIWNGWTWLFLLTVGGTVLFLLLHRRKFPGSPALPLFLMFLLSLTPYTGIFLLNGIFYEHYLYLPMLFFWGCLIFYCAPILRKKITLIVIVSVSVLYIGRSWVRQWDWIDAERFYLQTLKYAPKSLRIINGLGMAQAEKGDCKGAVETYKKAISLDPDVPNPYHNIANCHVRLGNFKTAEASYLRAIDASPNFHFSYSSLIRLYLQTGQTQKAKAFLKDKAIVQFPEAEDFKKIYNTL